MPQLLPVSWAHEGGGLVGVLVGNTVVVEELNAVEVGKNLVEVEELKNVVTEEKCVVVGEMPFDEVDSGETINTHCNKMITYNGWGYNWYIQYVKIS